MAAPSRHLGTGEAPVRSLITRMCGDLGLDPRPVADAVASAATVPLPAHTDAAGLCMAGVAVASLAAAVTAGAEPLPPDPNRVAVAVTSERHLRVGGQPTPAWAPLSGFWPTADGWVRTHGNYPHHAAILCGALGLPAGADEATLAAVLSITDAASACRRVERAGGLCVPVRREDADADVDLRQDRLIETRRLRASPKRDTAPAPVDAPLRGIRVLDLTRVIAGPVATRTLGLLGAEVLRLDPIDLPELPWQHLDTGHAKHSALLTAISPRGRARLHALIGEADVLVTGYRPGAAARLGSTRSSSQTCIRASSWHGCRRGGSGTRIWTGAGSIPWCRPSAVSVGSRQPTRTGPGPFRPKLWITPPATSSPPP